MSRPRYWWYGDVKRWIMRYPKLKDEKSNMAKRYVKAIEKAMSDLQETEDADLKLKSIELVLIKKTHTVDGVADIIYCSPAKIQRWISKFVYDVGRKAGY